MQSQGATTFEIRGSSRLQLARLLSSKEAGLHLGLEVVPNRRLCRCMFDLVATLLATATHKFYPFPETSFILYPWMPRFFSS
jgi:hypothetical protein